MITWHRRRGAPVDTHVLVHNSLKQPAWLDQCLGSLEDEPTNIQIVRSTSRNVGELRAAAHEAATAPLLSFVDDDDWVVPGAFQACIDALDDPALVGAYTDFTDVDSATGEPIGVYVKRPWSPRVQLLKPFEVLHVHVYRRAAALKYLAEMAQWVTLEESLLMGLLVQDGAWRKLDVDGYRKRAAVRGGAGSRITRAMLRTLTLRLKPILAPEPIVGVQSRYVFGRR